MGAIRLERGKLQEKKGQRGQKERHVRERPRWARSLAPDACGLESQQCTARGDIYAHKQLGHMGERQDKESDAK